MKQYRAASGSATSQSRHLFAVLLVARGATGVRRNQLESGIASVGEARGTIVTAVF